MMTGASVYQYYVRCWVNSGFCHDVHEITTLLGYESTYIGSHLLTFRDNLSAQKRQ